MVTTQDVLAELKSLEERFAVDTPELEVTVRDHNIGLEGYVVVWNTAPGLRGPLGPCGKGGTRITPTVSLDEIRMLAKTMALKNAAAGLAMGGAKSGLKADPDVPGFEQQYRRFVDLIRPLLRENGGPFGGLGFDIGARPIHPVWACDQLKSNRSFTGKPVDMGGTDYDKEGIAGLGVAVAAKTLLERTRGSVSGATVAIQGLGAMGAAVCRYLREFGAEVRAVSDPRLGGSFEFNRGISQQLVARIVEQDFAHAAILAQREATRVFSLDDILFESVDVVVPAALQGVITQSNQSRISAHAVVEGANNPTSPEAQALLTKRGVKVIPDFIANPGGIIAAFVELTSTVTPEENVQTRKNVSDAKAFTIEKISRNVGEVLDLVDESGVDTVSAARLIALRNLF